MKNIYNKIYLVLLVVALFFASTMVGCVLFGKRGQDILISEEKAIEIANKKAEDLRYDTQRMNIYADEQNSRWNNYLATSGIKNWGLELTGPLEKKIYWAIYYQPRWVIQRGGDLWVFVDKNSGEVITVIQGE